MCRYDSDAHISGSDDEEEGGGDDSPEQRATKRKKVTSKATNPPKRRKQVSCMVFNLIGVLTDLDTQLWIRLLCF